jgi:hypothetical protein
MLNARGPWPSACSHTEQQARSAKALVSFIALFGGTGFPSRCSIRTAGKAYQTRGFRLYAAADSGGRFREPTAGAPTALSASGVQGA